MLNTTQSAPRRLPNQPTPASALARAARLRAICKSYEAGVSGCYAAVRVLNGLTMDVRPGEVVGIVGSAGAGKSTLLLAIAGILQPDSGNIEWLSEGGSPVRDGAGIEYIPAWRPHHALQSLERAKRSSPGFLLIDDTFAALNSAARDDVRRLVRDLIVRGTTMVIAAREPATIKAMCSRMLRLSAGRVHTPDGRPRLAGHVRRARGA